MVLSCLFTAQKTQKRKKWNEGEVRFVASSKWAGLHVKHEGSGRVEPEPKDGKYMEPDEYAAVVAGAESTFETEKYLVEVTPPETSSASPLSGGRLAALAALDGPTLKKFKKPATAAPSAAPKDQLIGRPSRVVNYGRVEPDEHRIPDRQPSESSMLTRRPCSTGSRDDMVDANISVSGSVASWFADCPTELAPSPNKCSPGPRKEFSPPRQQSRHEFAAERGVASAPFVSFIPGNQILSRGLLGQGEGGAQATTCDDYGQERRDIFSQEAQNEDSFKQALMREQNVLENQGLATNNWFYGDPSLEPSHNYSSSVQDQFSVHKDDSEYTTTSSSSHGPHAFQGQTDQPLAPFYPTSNNNDLIYPSHGEAQGTKEAWLCECGVWSPSGAEQCEICGALALATQTTEAPVSYPNIGAPITVQTSIFEHNCASAQGIALLSDSVESQAEEPPPQNATTSKPCWFHSGDADEDEDDLLGDLLDDRQSAQTVAGNTSAALKEMICLPEAPAPSFSLAAGQESSDSDTESDGDCLI